MYASLYRLTSCCRRTSVPSYVPPVVPAMPDEWLDLGQDRSRGDGRSRVGDSVPPTADAKAKGKGDGNVLGHVDVTGQRSTAFADAMRVLGTPQSRMQDDQAAVAGTSAGDPAAPQIYGLEYFQNFNTWTSTYKQHNIALKWFRDSSERGGLDRVTFSNTQPEEVSELVHGEGTNYQFNEDVKNPWSWQEMVAQLDDASMRFVVEGCVEKQNRSRGLVSCCIRQTGKYDHKRHHADQGNQERMMKEWDFVLVRDDGSCLSLHPNYSNTKMTCKYGFAEEPDLEVPTTGLGGTDGPGTFKRITNKGVNASLRFDAQKAPLRKGKGKGKAKGKGKGGPGMGKGKGDTAVAGSPPPAPQASTSGSSTAVAVHGPRPRTDDRSRGAESNFPHERRVGV